MLVEEIGMITLQSLIRVTLLGIIKNYMVKVVQEILFLPNRRKSTNFCHILFVFQCE